MLRLESQKDLPDIYGLLQSLDEDEQDLLNSRSLAHPSLFDSDKQQAKYKYIDELKLQIADSAVDRYVQDFNQNVEDEILMIGSVSLEEVQVRGFHKSHLNDKYMEQFRRSAEVR